MTLSLSPAAGFNGQMSPEAVPAKDFKHLPEPIPLDQTIETKAASAAPAPDMGHDSEHEWMLRFSAG